MSKPNNIRVLSKLFDRMEIVEEHSPDPLRDCPKAPRPKRRTLRSIDPQRCRKLF